MFLFLHILPKSENNGGQSWREKTHPSVMKGESWIAINFIFKKIQDNVVLIILWMDCERLIVYRPIYPSFTTPPTIWIRILHNIVCLFITIWRFTYPYSILIKLFFKELLPLRIFQQKVCMDNSSYILNGVRVIVFSTIFQLYCGGQFYWWKNWRKPLTCRKSLTNFIT